MGICRHVSVLLFFLLLSLRRYRRAWKRRVGVSLALALAASLVLYFSSSSRLQTSHNGIPFPIQKIHIISTSSLLSGTKQIVNKGGNEPSSSYSATAARYRSSSSGRSSSLRSASISARRLSTHVGASSSKAASDAGQALLNINKLKEKSNNKKYIY